MLAGFNQGESMIAEVQKTSRSAQSESSWNFLELLKRLGPGNNSRATRIALMMLLPTESRRKFNLVNKKE